VINLLDLYLIDAPGKTFAAAGSKEHRGPCPKCGGTDRFGVFPLQNNGAGSFFCGRQKGGGNGCGLGGDAIEYLRKIRGLSYREACDFLGIEAKGKQNSQRSTRYRYQLPSAPVAQAAFMAEAKSYPSEVVDAALWVAKGMEFVEKCHQELLSRPLSIVYLQNRGIGMASIKKYNLGFWGGNERNGLEYQTAYRPRSAWGLSAEKNANNKPRMMALPAGLVIPYLVDGRLHRLTIRLLRPDPQTGKKYHYVTGSIRDLWLSNPGARAFITQEAELDCIAIDEAAGDLVGTVGIGSTGVRPDLRTATILEQSLCILGGLDFDGLGSKAAAAVVQAGQWWEKTYSQYQRWPVPAGKDAGEFFQAGGDLRLWVMAGLPDFLLPAADKANSLPAVIPVDTALPNEVEPMTEMGPVPEMAKAEAVPVPPVSRAAGDLAELKELLRQSRGYVRIFDGGINVAKEVPAPWQQKEFAASGRLSWLLNNSLVVADWIGNRPDGLYKADDIRC